METETQAELTVDQKADALIARYKSKRSFQIGEVVNGDPQYHYAWVDQSGDQHQVVAALKAQGYELETNPEVMMFGFAGGNLWKLPQKVRDFYRAERKKRHDERFGPQKKRYIQ